MYSQHCQITFCTEVSRGSLRRIRGVLGWIRGYHLYARFCLRATLCCDGAAVQCEGFCVQWKTTLQFIRITSQTIEPNHSLILLSIQTIEPKHLYHPFIKPGPSSQIIIIIIIIIRGYQANEGQRGHQAPRTRGIQRVFFMFLFRRSTGCCPRQFVSRSHG